MSETSGNWVYFLDDVPVTSSLKEEVRSAVSGTPASSQQCVLAIAMHLEGRTDDAIRQCHRGLERGEHLPELYGTLAQIQFEAGRLHESAQAYQKQLLLDPKHLTAWYNLGLCQERSGRWKDAADSFRKALESELTRESAVLGLGISLLHLDQFEHAMVLLDDYLGPNPRHQTALWGKAVALHRLGRFQEAVELYALLAPVPSNAVDILTNEVALHLARPDYDSAHSCALQLLEIQPLSRPALEALATIAFQRQTFEDAARYCSQLVQVAPSYEAWFNLGFARHRTGSLAGAAHAYQEAAQLKPNAEPAYAHLGTVYHEQGDLPEARSAYERALRLAPDRSATVWNFGLLLEQLGLPLEAEKQYLKVCALQEDWEEPWLRIGYLRLGRNDAASAIEAWEKALTVQPNSLDARYNLAFSYWRQGDSTLARDQFEALLNDHPDLVEAARALTILSMDRRDGAAARHYHSRLADLGVLDPDLSYNVGLLLQELNQPGEALPLYQQALIARPGFVEALVNLGYACESLGQEQEARIHWEQATRVDHHLTDQYLARSH